MPSASKIAAFCAAASAVGGAAFVQPGATRAAAQPQASAAVLRRWEPAPGLEAQAGAEGFPAKGFLAGLALGLGVALVGAQDAQAEATAAPAAKAAPAKAAPAKAQAVPAKAAPAKKALTDIRDAAYRIEGGKDKADKDFEKQKEAIAKQMNKKDKDGVSLQTWKYGRDYDKKYTQTSTGTGTFLRYNLGNYQIIPSYRGTPKDDGKMIIDPKQIELAKLQRRDDERIKKEVAPKWLKDGGATGNIWPSQGMYKPRTYTSSYMPVRQGAKSSLELSGKAPKVPSAKLEKIAAAPSLPAYAAGSASSKPAAAPAKPAAAPAKPAAKPAA